MRTALGILLLIGGLLWAAPGAFLLGMGLQNGRHVTQTGPNEFRIVDSTTIHDITVFGQPVSYATACAISLVPGTALLALGLYFLFKDGRGQAPRSSDRAAE